MHIKLDLFAIAILCGVLPSAIHAAPASAKPVARHSGIERRIVDGEYLVTIPSDVDHSELIARAIGSENEDHGVLKRLQFDSAGVYHVKSHPRLLENLNDLGVEATVEPNVITQFTQVGDIPINGTEIQEITKRTTADSRWSLWRIAESDASGQYLRPSNEGAGSVIYVVDSGVRKTHNEFGNRVVDGWCVPAKTGYTGGCDDVFGHGTSVAGSAAGAQFGAAPRATIVNVRISGDNGVTVTSDSVTALQWILQDVNRRWPNQARPRAVVNFSGGSIGKASSATLTAINNLISRRVFFVAAAGNNGDDACNHTPAYIPEVLTVTATSVYPFQGYNFYLTMGWTPVNFGPCVDFAAPGLIWSAQRSSNVAFDWSSGTSFAAPVVSGVIALIMSHKNDFANTNALKEYLTKQSLEAKKKWPTHQAKMYDGDTSKPLIYNGRAHDCNPGPLCGLQNV